MEDSRMNFPRTVTVQWISYLMKLILWKILLRDYWMMWEDLLTTGKAKSKKQLQGNITHTHHVDTEF